MKNNVENLNIVWYIMLVFYGVLLVLCFIISIDQAKIDGKKPKNKSNKHLE